MTEPTDLDQAPGCNPLRRFGALPLIGLGLIGLVAVIAGIVVLGGGDDDGDGDVQTVDSPATSDATPSTETPDTGSGVEATPSEDPDGEDVAEDPEDRDALVEALIAALGQLDGYDAADACRASEAAAGQTGGSPLEHPSLMPGYVCAGVFRVSTPLVAPGPPIGAGDWLLVAGITDEPYDPATNIAMQPGIGFDRPADANRAARTQGEGLGRVEIDLVAYGESAAGWARAAVYNPDDFAPLDLEMYAYASPDSRVQAFVLPVTLVTPDTIVYFQTFGRQTPAGALATQADPAASYRVDLGPLGGCVVEPGACVIPPVPGRYEVTAVRGGTELTGVEPGAGAFWFFEQDQLDVVVKVLNACDFNDRYWVFAGGLTDVAVTITVTDTESDTIKTFDSGAPFAPILDTEAFATCP